MRTSDARPPYQVECSMPNAKGNTSIQSPLHPLCLLSGASNFSYGLQ